VVPAAYCNIAKEIHSCALKVIMRSSTERHTDCVLSALNALQSCVMFHLRCGRDEVASRVCVTALKMLHTGGRVDLAARDEYLRRIWTGEFLMMCTNYIYCLFFNDGFFGAAMHVLVQCKTIMEASEGLTSMNVAAISHNLACCFEKMDEYDDAEEEYKNALRISTALGAAASHGPQTGGVADILLGLGALHEKQNRIEEAESAYAKALRLYEDADGHDSLGVAQVNPYP
jgi:tetratricopeptide (TPR) repeat protein